MRFLRAWLALLCLWGAVCLAPKAFAGGEDGCFLQTLRPYGPDMATELLNDLTYRATQSPVDIRQRVNYQDCRKYPFGGPTGVKIDFNRALAQGLGCLKEKAPRYERTVALGLTFLFHADLKEKPLKLVCDLEKSEETGTTAMGLPNSEIGPTIIVSPLRIAEYTETSKRQGVLFHEFMHVLGFEHAFSIDVAMLTQECCFAPQSPTQSKACGFLRDGDDWTGLEYLSFINELADQSETLENLAAARMAVWNSSRYLWIHENGKQRRSGERMMEFALRHARERDTGSPRETTFAIEDLVLGVASLDHLPPESRKRLTEEFEKEILTRVPAPQRLVEGAIALGKAYSKGIAGDIPGMLRAWTTAKKYRDVLCVQHTDLAYAMNGMSAGLYHTLSAEQTRSIPAPIQKELAEICPKR